MDKFNIIAEQEHQTVMAHYDALPREDKGYQSEAALEAEFISQLTEQGYERVNIASEEALLKNLRQQMERLNRLILSNTPWPQSPCQIPAQPDMRDLLQQEEESKQELKALFEKLGYNL